MAHTGPFMGALPLVGRESRKRKRHVHHEMIGGNRDIGLTNSK